MSDRIAAAVWVKPRRRIAFVGGLAAFLAAVMVLIGALSSDSSAAPAKRRVHRAGNAGLSQAQINANVDKLISQMTVDEKFGQLEMAGPSTPNGSDLAALAKAGQIGSVLDLVGVDNINAVQKAALQSRLRIPLIFGLDVIHGYRTMFPVPLGEASSWDPRAVSSAEAIPADEAAADGIKWTFNPMVDISRDPRWGRVVEGAGEDPFLGSAIAPPRFAAIRARTSARPTGSPRRSSTSRRMEPRSRVANTTRSTCRRSSC